MIRRWFISYPRLCVASGLWLLCSVIAVSVITYDPAEPSLLLQSSDVLLTSRISYIANSIAAVFLQLFGWSGVFLIPIGYILSGIVLQWTTITYAQIMTACAMVCTNAIWCSYIGFEPFVHVLPGGWVGRYAWSCIARWLPIEGMQYIDVGLRAMLATVGIATFRTRWVRYIMPYVHTTWNAAISATQYSFTAAYNAMRRNADGMFPSIVQEHIAREHTREESDDHIFYDAFWNQQVNKNQFSQHSMQADDALSDISSSHTSSQDDILDYTDPLDSGGQNNTEYSQGNHSFNNAIHEDAYATGTYTQPHHVVQPTMHLLSQGVPPQDEADETARQQAQRLEEKLKTFGITGTVTHIRCGPVVTLFSYQPDQAVKVANITAREDDLRLALEAVSLRIIAPIPGTSVVGFEVSRPHPQSVMLKQLIDTDDFWRDDIALPLALGTDTAGEPFVGDLAKMPHVLVAGSTGSGKSVALHSFLLSLLYRCHPDTMKLTLIDPKRLEFASYRDIPHLATPVITQSRTVVKVFEWLVQEMERRYDLLAQAGVRNISEYHHRYGADALPYNVVVVDELADLMMGVGKDIEQYIARLAQMARAAGIHLIVATQRPSVDVITGMIKVNFLSRIAFKVTSKIDSRTIIDQPGAEKLLGRGDMLHLDSRGVLHRLHGGFVTQDEIDAVVGHWNEQPYEREFLFDPSVQDVKSDAGSDEEDDLYDDVVSYAKTCDTISISLIQRRFRIGYNRSARLVDALERNGIVSAADTNKVRRVLQ